MENQLKSFTRISSINSKNIHKHLTKIKTFTKNQMIELHKTGAIDDEMLKYTTGIKFYTHKVYQKIPGPTTKYFSCKTLGYAYPLFKTHKLQPDNLKTISIFDISVQSAGNISTSKITALLEHIFQSVSVKFCKSFVNEYCRDSKQYFEDITYWKATKKYQNDIILYIAAGDVKALYPNVPRLLVKKALTFVLKRFSQYTDAAVENLVNIALFCFGNVIIQYKDSFFTHKNGIVTRNNHSVSLANIALHYLILPISSTINQSMLFKRFIDDIIWLSYGLDTTTKLKQALICEFQEYDIELSFRDINTSENNACFEFLDVEHKIDSNFAGRFYTRNFIKPTAINRTFLNGKSFHPQHIFKSIMFSESIRLRRLNESKPEYLKSLECLRKKCIQSNFKTKIVEKIIFLASTWTGRFKPNKTSETKTENFKRRIVWETSFPNFLKLEARELHLVPNTNIVFKRPPTLFNIITNYKGFCT